MFESEFIRSVIKPFLKSNESTASYGSASDAAPKGALALATAGV